MLADEINRATPKTQAALLEAMQEQQVTVGGGPSASEPFFVMATQNPLEQEGTYPLPEAQLDRFLVRIEMGLPEPAAGSTSTAGPWPAPCRTGGEVFRPPMLRPGEARALRRAARRVHVAEELLTYLAALTAGVRRSPQVDLGVSPRAALALLEAGRAGALIEGRDFLTPDDLKRLLVPCWGHRLLLTPESELEGFSPRQLLEGVAAAVPVPH